MSSPVLKRAHFSPTPEPGSSAFDFLVPARTNLSVNERIAGNLILEVLPRIFLPEDKEKVLSMSLNSHEFKLQGTDKNGCFIQSVSFEKLRIQNKFSQNIVLNATKLWDPMLYPEINGVSIRAHTITILSVENSTRLFFGEKVIHHFHLATEN